MVNERLAKPFKRAFADDALVDDGVVEAGFAASKQPHFVAGIPARMTAFPAAKAGKAWKLPRVCVRASDSRLDRRGKLGGDALVGIDGQHPIPRGQRQRIVLLRPITAPFLKLDAGAFCPRDLHGRIRAAAIDHDALVAECEAIEAGGDIHRLVLGDYNRAELRHGLSFVCGRLPPRPAAISAVPSVLLESTTTTSSVQSTLSTAALIFSAS